jgi:hypothetical protein
VNSLPPSHGPTRAQELSIYMIRSATAITREGTMARQRLSSSYNRFHFIIKLTILAFLHKYLHSFLLKCIERFRFIVKNSKL